MFDQFRSGRGRSNVLGLQVKTGDSSSWTSLSIWMSILMVISSSALRFLAMFKPEYGCVAYKIWSRL